MSHAIIDSHVRREALYSENSCKVEVRERYKEGSHGRRKSLLENQASQGNHIRSQHLNALTLVVTMRLTTPSSLMSLGYARIENTTVHCSDC